MTFLGCHPPRFRADHGGPQRLRAAPESRRSWGTARAPAHASPSARPCHVPAQPSPAQPVSLQALTDGDGRHNEGVPEEKRRGLGREVAAEILQEQVLLGLLLGAAFGSHGGIGAAGRARNLAESGEEATVTASTATVSANDQSAQREEAGPVLAWNKHPQDWPVWRHFVGFSGVIRQAGQTSGFLASHVIHHILGGGRDL